MVRHTMVSARLHFAAALVVLRLSLADGQAPPIQGTTNPYIDVPKDAQVSKLGKVKTGEMCGEGFKGKEELDGDRDVRRKVLEDRAGEGNTIKKVLTEAKSPDDMGTKMEEELNPTAIAFQVFPLVLMMLMIFAYLICCWTCCPCCKRCRCGAKEKRTPIVVKLVIAVIVFGMFLGILISGIQASLGYNAAVAGFENMGCTSAKLLENSLNGETTNNFIGMLPLLETFYKMDQLLVVGSPFMSDITGVIDDTAEIDSAVILTSKTLDLLSDALTANLNPGGPEKMHQCTFCSTVSPLVAPLSNSVANGVGSALSSARGEVKTQLTGQGGTELSGVLVTAAAPVKDMKDMIRDNFELFVADDGAFASMSEQIKGNGFKSGVAFLIVWACLVALCSGIGQGAFILCPGTNMLKKIAPVGNMMDKVEAAANKDAAQNGNPYGRTVPCCTCFSWCCGFPLTWVALLFGGLFLLLAMPMSGTCLIMDEMDGVLLKSMMPALGMNMTADASSMDMTIDLIDKCFAAKGNTNANLLDIIHIQNATGGNPSLRAEIVEKTKDMITGQFDNVAATLMGEDLALSSNQAVLSLRQIFRDTDVDGMIIPTTAMASASEFSQIASTGVAGLLKFGAASLKCDDYDASAVNAAFSGLPVVPGVKTVTAALPTSQGSVSNGVVGEPCNQQLTCIGSACQELDVWLGWKEVLKEDAVYHCDVFQNSAGAACDPKDMVFNSVTQQWSSDCLLPDGTVTVKQVTCTLPQFVQYIKDYDIRLQQVFDRLDKAVLSSKTGITQTMKEVVYRDIITPIDTIADGATCGFLGVVYRELVDGFCFQGVYGLVWIAQMYVAAAIMTIILMIFTYTVWRISIDNRNKWEPSQDVVV